MAEAMYFPIVLNKDKNYCIDIRGQAMKNGTPIHLYKQHGGKSQLWNYDGTYIRSAVDSNYVIDVSGGKYQNGRKLQIYKFNGSHAQKWDYSNNMFISRGNSKYCIDLHDANTRNDQKIHLQPRRSGGHPAQFWTWAKPQPKAKPAKKAKKQVVQFVGVSWGIADTIMMGTSRSVTIKTGYNDGSTSENESTNSNSKSNSKSSTKTDNFEWSVDASASGGFYGVDFEASAHTGGSTSNENSTMSASEASNVARMLNTATKTSYGESTETVNVEAMNIDTYILTARIRGKLGNKMVSIHTGAHRRWPCDKKPWPELPPIDSLM